MRGRGYYLPSRCRFLTTLRSRSFSMRHTSAPMRRHQSETRLARLPVHELSFDNAATLSRCKFPFTQRLSIRPMSVPTSQQQSDMYTARSPVHLLSKPHLEKMGMGISLENERSGVWRAACNSGGFVSFKERCGMAGVNRRKLDTVSNSWTE